MVFFGNSDKTTDSTLIVARRGARGAAERVREALGIGTVEMETDTLRRVDVTVILGEDYRPEEDGRP